MTRKEFTDLVTQAAGTEFKDGYPFDDMAPLEGLALHKERRTVSRRGALGFIRYQALYLDNTWDRTELEDLAYSFRRVDLVADPKEPGEPEKKDDRITRAALVALHEQYRTRINDNIAYYEKAIAKAANVTQATAIYGANIQTEKIKAAHLRDFVNDLLSQ